MNPVVELRCQSKKKRRTRHRVEFDSLPNQNPDDQPVANETTEPVLSRPERERRPPDYYGEWATITSTDLNEPKTVKEALASPEKAKWMTAMDREDKIR